MLVIDTLGMAERVAHEVQRYVSFQHARTKLRSEIVKVQVHDVRFRADDAPPFAEAFTREHFAGLVTERILAGAAVEDFFQLRPNRDAAFLCVFGFDGEDDESIPNLGRLERA